MSDERPIDVEDLFRTWKLRRGNTTVLEEVELMDAVNFITRPILNRLHEARAKLVRAGELEIMMAIVTSIMTSSHDASTRGEMLRFLSD